MPPKNGQGYSLLVAQAAGMVSVQAECMLSQAIVMMESRAKHDGITLDELAVAVTNRKTRFGS